MLRELCTVGQMDAVVSFQVVESRLTATGMSNITIQCQTASPSSLKTPTTARNLSTRRSPSVGTSPSYTSTFASETRTETEMKMQSEGTRKTSSSSPRQPVKTSSSSPCQPVVEESTAHDMSALSADVTLSNDSTLLLKMQRLRARSSER